MKNVRLKKIAASTIAATLLFSAASSAQAASVVSGNFNVDINLISACNVSTPGALSFTYTALQTTAATASTPFTVTCVTGLPYTVTVSNPNTTDDAVGLLYNLSVLAPVGGGTGNGTAQNYSIDGTIPAGQAGTCTTASCTNAAATNNVKTVTVGY
jgi:spore coat protein U-like protein